MPTESMPRPLARQLLRVVLGSGDIADRDLLARFASTRDEDAFAELVRRHGTMVFGVCRRVTRHPQDAEDAFQAAFVVLARRAAQVRNPEQLANWLYGVAYRTALEARATRRRVQEQPVSAAPEPAAPPEPDDTADLRRVIDEELAKLPDKYRSAVVLCDLEGMPRAAAAAQLQIPEGTLSSRLAQARKPNQNWVVADPWGLKLRLKLLSVAHASRTRSRSAPLLNPRASPCKPCFPDGICWAAMEIRACERLAVPQRPVRLCTT